MEIVPEGSTEKVNVAMASGDFPDVVTELITDKALAYLSHK